MTLTWGSPVDNEGRDGMIQSYSLNCESEQDLEYILIDDVDNETLNFTVEMIHPYKSYECCISVQTTNGNSTVACAQETTLEEGTLKINLVFEDVYG